MTSLKLKLNLGCAQMEAVNDWGYTEPFTKPILLLDSEHDTFILIFAFSCTVIKHSTHRHSFFINVAFFSFCNLDLSAYY